VEGLDERELEKKKAGGLSEDEQRRVEAALAGAEAAAAGEEDDYPREYALIMEALQLQRAKLGRYNLDLYKTEARALGVSMLLENADVDERIRHAKHCHDFLDYTCSENHPLVLLQAMTLAELYEASGHPPHLRLAGDMYGCIARGCQVCYGKDHEYVQLYQKREKKALNDYKGDDPKEGFQTQDEGGAAGAARRAHMHWGRKQEYYQPRF
jgi:hypothetical protein